MRGLVPLLTPVTSRLLAIATTVALLAGCSERERSNPFDPHNLITHGQPVGFMALAGNGRVDLRWEEVRGEGLVGYQVFRRTTNEPDFLPLSSILPPAITRYSDLGLLNGLDHTYRLFYVFGDGFGNEPAEDTATPGNAMPWVVDATAGTLSRLTPDGRHVAFRRLGFSGPSAVDVDSITGQVWVSDAVSGKLTVIDPSTGVTVTVPGFVAPGAVAVNSGDHTAWLCDENADVVHHFDPTGAPILNPIEPLVTPIGAAVDPNDGSVWICERGAGRVRRHQSDHALIWSISVDRPSRVAVDSLSRRGWVTSFEGGRVFRITGTGTTDGNFTGFAGPIGIVVDPRRGVIWVADARANTIVALDRSGAELWRTPGLPEVRDLAVDPESGEVWAVLPGSGEVVRLSPSGQVLRRLSGFGSPYGIAIDPGRRP